MTGMDHRRSLTVRAAALLVAGALSTTGCRARSSAPAESSAKPASAEQSPRQALRVFCDADAHVDAHLPAEQRQHALVAYLSANLHNEEVVEWLARLGDATPDEQARLTSTMLARYDITDCRATTPGALAR